MTGCVLDADVAIAALDRGDAHHSDARRLISGLSAASTPLRISAVNYAEVLTRPAEDEASLRLAVDALASLGIRAIPATGVIAREAARIRARGLALADGFALATARSIGSPIASFDRRVVKVAGELGVACAT